MYFLLIFVYFCLFFPFLHCSTPSSCYCLLGCALSIEHGAPHHDSYAQLSYGHNTSSACLQLMDSCFMPCFFFLSQMVFCCLPHHVYHDPVAPSVFIQSPLSGFERLPFIPTVQPPAGLFSHFLTSHFLVFCGSRQTPLTLALPSTCLSYHYPCYTLYPPYPIYSSTPLSSSCPRLPFPPHRGTLDTESDVSRLTLEPVVKLPTSSTSWPPLHTQPCRATTATAVHTTAGTHLATTTIRAIRAARTVCVSTIMLVWTTPRTATTTPTAARSEDMRAGLLLEVAELLPEPLPMGCRARLGHLGPPHPLLMATSLLSSPASPVSLPLPRLQATTAWTLPSVPTTSIRTWTTALLLACKAFLVSAELLAPVASPSRSPAATTSRHSRHLCRLACRRALLPMHLAAAAWTRRA